MVTQVPVKGALDTHYHYDHSMGNSFYGANGVPLWAHEAVAKRIVDAYAPLQGVAKEKALARYEKRVQDAPSDLARAHAQSDLNAMTGDFAMANASVLSLPNHLLDPAKLPLSIDLGGLTAILEYHPGHSGTDIIVRVPAQNVVYTGDLLFNGLYPVCFDSQATVSGWRATINKFAAFDKDTLFVPGHGQLCGQEAIASIREGFDDIAARAETMYKAGVPVEEARHRYVVPDKYKNLLYLVVGLLHRVRYHHLVCGVENRQLAQGIESGPQALRFSAKLSRLRRVQPHNQVVRWLVGASSLRLWIPFTLPSARRKRELP